MKTYESEVKRAINFVESQLDEAMARGYESTEISIDRFAYKQGKEYLKEKSICFFPCVFNNLLSYWACGEDCFYRVRVFLK